MNEDYICVIVIDFFNEFEFIVPIWNKSVD